MGLNDRPVNNVFRSQRSISISLAEKIGEFEQSTDDGGGRKGLRYCGIGLFLVRCCGNFYFKVRYCSFQSPSGVR